MLRYFIIASVVICALINLTVARPSPEEAAKFVELQHTIKELTTTILKMNQGDASQAMMTGIHGDSAADFQGLLN